MPTYSNRLQPALQNTKQNVLFGSSTRDRHAGRIIGGFSENSIKCVVVHNDLYIYTQLRPQRIPAIGVRTFRPTDTSPRGRTFRPMGVSAYRRFDPETTHPIDISPHGRC